MELFVQIDKIYDVKYVKVQSTFSTHQYSWMVGNNYELAAIKDTEV